MHVPRRALAAAVALLLLPGLAGARHRGRDESRSRNRLPAFVVGPIARTSYDGAPDDLLTGGLGKSGLAAAAAPAFADPLHPTAAELRTRAIFNNYRALVDVTAAGGFGTLFGPNVDADGNVTASEGRIAGDEWLAYADDGSGGENVTMMVQVPATFDPENACIVTATSSGSRGVYGAIGTAGEWGLKRGCAVAYTDKGTGNGAHDLGGNTVGVITGERVAAAAAGTASSFTAPLSPAELAAFVAANPNRWAFKHAHSRLNPEKDWGRDTLRAVEFAFWVLNEMHGAPAPGGGTFRTIRRGNTIAIASSVSNGGGAALAAAEQDRHGLIDGVVAGEPQIQVGPDPEVAILRGGVPVAASGKPLFDYGTVANLYQPCAALAVPDSPGAAFVNAARAANRCAALTAAGLLSGATAAEQAADALARLRAAGWEADSDVLHASHYAFATPAVAVTYASSYGRFGVEENPCGFSFAATDALGAPAPLAPAAAAQIFASGNGIPPTGGVNIVNDLSAGGPLLDGASVSPGGAQDLNVPGALCLRRLFTGRDEAGHLLEGAGLLHAIRVRLGIHEVRRHADLHGLPAILVQGRSDALVPVNHASRAYLAKNAQEEGRRSGVHYYEVANAQHFDAFIGNALLPGYANRFVPLHRYFVQAMDLMWAHLKHGVPLPPSQVVRTTPRGGAPGAAPPIAAANVPPIAADPAPGDRIAVDRHAVRIPE